MLGMAVNVFSTTRAKTLWGQGGGPGEGGGGPGEGGGGEEGGEGR